MSEQSLWRNVELPAELNKKAAYYRNRLIATLQEQGLPSLDEALDSAITKSNEICSLPCHKTDFLRQLNHMFACSEFVANTCGRTPQMFFELIASGALFEPLSDDFLVGIKEKIDGCESMDALEALLRRERNRFMLRIIWRDFTRLTQMQDTTEELSRFADVMIQAAAKWHYDDLVKQWGAPKGGESGEIQTLLIIAMGKLGAHELNVSSDIDLIFAYPEAGQTQGVGETLDNQEFFVRLGQRLIKSLDTQTEDGFVFRVDMRLRPHGQSGSLVLNFNALDNYYQSQGRDWERYAMIKARVIAQDDSVVSQIQAGALMAILKPFTYRKYIDFSVIDSLRAMKGLINRQVQRQGMELDVKLGAGGIREVEFVVQMFQLIRGGRDLRLQERKVCKLLPLLEQEQYLVIEAGQKLLAAYTFLRNVEHGIQGFQDRQTQALPMDELGCVRLSWLMGYMSWTAFIADLNRHRALVNREFQSVIAEPIVKTNDVGDDAEWTKLWQGTLSESSAKTHLLMCGGKDAGAVFDVIKSLKEQRTILCMQGNSRERLDVFMPRLLAVLFREVKNAKLVLQRLVPFIESVARRSTYLVLLVENPVALTQLVILSAESPWIANQLVHHPILLDELLTPRKLYAPPNLQELRDELRREVLRLPWNDLEGHMEALRYFRAAHALRVAASEATGSLPVMQVSDYLTFIAEVILEHVLALAWGHMVGRHGYPQMTTGQCERLPNFIVVAYGKLGGLELGHGSDLDLVFVHGADPACSTDGERVIDNLTFYARLGQRIIHILSTHTISGPLYEIDMRLRPSGNSGMLVTSLSAFEKYQHNEAWVWEQQALVRARVVTGSNDLAIAFNKVRRSVLIQKRNLPELRSEVVSMREKMRTHLVTKRAVEAFDLKQGEGGIVDIEFMVQYAVLAWARKIPELAQYSDNIRILEILELAGCLDTLSVVQLVNAYKSYRSAGHELVLQGQKTLTAEQSQSFSSEREHVSGIWQQILLQDAGV